MIHSLTDGGEGIAVDALLDLSLGSLQGVLLSPLQDVRCTASLSFALLDCKAVPVHRVSGKESSGSFQD